MLLLSRLTAIGAISNAFASYLGFFWPVLARGVGRVIAISVVLGVLGAINYLGVRYGTWVSNLFTIAKLAPLVLFVVAGAFAADIHRFENWTHPTGSGLQQASLLLIFAFGGFEFAVVPGGEAVDPKKDLPTALISAMACVTVLYALIQLVTQGSLPDLASSATPLADASRRFLGPAGGLLLAVGAVLSTTGTNSGTLLTGPRIIYAMADGRQLPSLFARVHPSYRTPHIAVVSMALLGWVGAVLGGFALLAAISAIARLCCYMSTCAALPVLRRKMPEAHRRFFLPGGAAIPTVACAISVWLLVGSTATQVLICGASLLAGALVYGCYRWIGAASTRHLGQRPGHSSGSISASAMSYFARQLQISRPRAVRRPKV
jgi:amino acid transporter